MSMASGFSQLTCLPAARIALTCGKCSRLGEVTWTTSIVVVGEQLVEVVVGPWHAEAGGSFGAALVAGTKQAAHLHADAAQPLDVDGADKATADDGRADIAQGSFAGHARMVMAAVSVFHSANRPYGQGQVHRRRAVTVSPKISSWRVHRGSGFSQPGAGVSAGSLVPRATSLGCSLRSSASCCSTTA